MENTIFIPEKIKVGYQERKDTYTGKLAYVIYYKKGKLHKEKSWINWCDAKLESSDYVNEPLEGFVLNKKVGDYKSDWNHRKAYCRVYDPRGFEFEITIENLLYILENANSIKGKGLEGQFIYGWDSKDLILIPTSSPDYQALANHSQLINKHDKFNSKNLILGAKYLTDKNEEWIYLGRFDYWENSKKEKHKETNEWNYIQCNVNKGKRYYFYNDGFETITSLDKIIKLVDDNPDENYANYMELLEYAAFYSPIDYNRPEYLPRFKQDENGKHQPIYYYGECYSYDSDYHVKINGEYIKVYVWNKHGYYSNQIMVFYKNKHRVKQSWYYTDEYRNKDILTELGEYKSEYEMCKNVNIYTKVFKYLVNGKEWR